MEKISNLLEKSLVAALNAAAEEVVVKLLEGIPTTEVMKQIMQEELTEAGSALSEKGASYLDLEKLKTLPKKCDLTTFLGMIKGKSAQAGMKARQVYDLSLLLKTIAPAKSFVVSEDDCVEIVGKSLASLSTKISSAVASYLVPAGIEKVAVVDAFSDVEEGMMTDITEVVNKVIRVVLSKLSPVEDDS